METNPIENIENIDNQTSLLEEIKTDDTSSSSSDTSIKMTAVTYTFPAQPKILSKDHVEHEIESNFKLYKIVIWVYCIISLLQIAYYAHSILQGFQLGKLVTLMIYVISFAIWLYGSQGLWFRCPKYHYRFQGMLIAFMLYHIVICARVILDSYTVIPNMTFTSFGLNAIYGIFIPVLVYYRADELRSFLEANTQKSIV